MRRKKEKKQKDREPMGADVGPVTGKTGPVRGPIQPQHGPPNGAQSQNSGKRHIKGRGGYRTYEAPFREKKCQIWTTAEGTARGDSHMWVETLRL